MDARTQRHGAVHKERPHGGGGSRPHEYRCGQGEGGQKWPFLRTSFVDGPSRRDRQRKMCAFVHSVCCLQKSVCQPSRQQSTANFPIKPKFFGLEAF
jgi:hypothetical protein